MSQAVPEGADRYRLAKRAAALVVVEAKNCVWEEFGEATGRDVRQENHSATQKGNVCLSQAACPGWITANLN